VPKRFKAARRTICGRKGTLNKKTARFTGRS
jgi:hypothetical protein